MASVAASVGGQQPPSKKELLSLRLSAAEIASASAALEIRTAGGKGYASRTPASRRYREAAFLPVQSPSEAQLRWELGDAVE
ncbi:ntrC domain protein [Mycobacterium kansasii]|uniref:NtrC domain protein n=1 Tax=Mycobacterium kansasii TaxID=1768 RepID=A0A1V3X2D9_MYCKA|nr:ntrC domain protein [Mycobacterium kansasii]